MDKLMTCQGHLASRSILKSLMQVHSNNISYNYKKKTYAKKNAPSKRISQNCKLFLVDHIGPWD